MVDVENDLFRVHNPMDIPDITPTPVLIAAMGPVMCRLAGERTDGTILWMGAEKAIGEHIAPTIPKAAAGAGRTAPAIVPAVPVCPCRPEAVDADQPRANRVPSHHKR